MNIKLLYALQSKQNKCSQNIQTNLKDLTVPLF